MKVFMWIMGGVVSLIIMGAIVCATAYVSANNYGATVEASLRASRDDNKNILAQYQQKVLEIAQVPAMYRDDFKAVVEGAVSGRYGADGSKAVVQWIKESNINFDSSLYIKLTETIQAGRKDFEIGQTRMIDIRRGYETNMGYMWRGFWLKIAGYPKINLKDYQPITTTNVEETFSRGKELAPLKLR